MASTFSDNLRLELIADGERSSTWGQQTNNNLQLIENAISGMVTIATTGGDTTLTSVNGATDQARYAILKITGVLVSNSNIIVPDETKQYLIWNATTGAYTVTAKTAAGTGVYIVQGGADFVFCDATNVVSAGRSVVDSTFKIADETDPSKLVAFQLSGLTTGTTRTLTVQDASGTLALTSNKLSAFAATTSAELAGVVSDETGTGALVFANTPTLVTPALGTPSALVGTNITGTATGLTAGNVTTNANLTGHVTSTGNAAVLGSFTFAQLNTAVSDANVAVAGANADITGLTALTVLVMPGSAAPAQTTEGSIAWDTNDDKIMVGDGSSTLSFLDEESDAVIHDRIAALAQYALIRTGVLEKSIDATRNYHSQTGTASVSQSASTEYVRTYPTAAVTFSRPFPDTAYQVHFEVLTGTPTVSFAGEVQANSKATNGFTLAITGSATAASVRWTASYPNAN